MARRSTSAATRSQIATSESRSWVTMTTVRPRLCCRPADQPVEVGGADRVEAGGRLVEEQDLRVEGQGAGEPGALAHAAGQLGRIFVAGVDRQADQRELEAGRSAAAARSGRRKRSRSGVWMFSATVSELNSAPSWNSTPWRACSARRAASSRPRSCCPSTSISPALGLRQAEDAAQQHRLAGAGAADDAEHLAAADLEVEPVVDDLRPKRVRSPLTRTTRSSLNAFTRRATRTRSRTSRRTRSPGRSRPPPSGSSSADALGAAARRSAPRSSRPSRSRRRRPAP